MANLTTHLQRRGARYYFRKRLPGLFVKVLERSHLVRSLKTSCPRHARRQARRLSARLEDAFEDVETMSEVEKRAPTRAELDQILMDIFTEILEVGEIHRASRTTGYRAEAVEDDLSPAHDLLGMTNSEWRRAQAGLKLELNDLQSAEQTIQPKLDHYHLRLPDEEVERKLFLRQVLATETAAHSIDMDRDKGTYYRPEHPFVTTAVPFGSHASEISVATSRERLSDAFETFVQTKAQERQYTAKSENQARYALHLWIDLMGDRPFAEVQRADAASFRTKLAGLPALSGRKIYADTSPSHAAEMRAQLETQLNEGKSTVQIEGHRLSREDGERYAKPLTPKTINRHLTYLSEFYSWKIDIGGYTFQNPFSGVFYSKAHVRKATNSRQTWKLDRLQTLFTSPVWTGCVSHGNRVSPGDIIYEDVRFWAPLIALHSGMREQEICALECGHISYNQEAECWFFYVAQGKTENARRYVPLHPNLVEIGLLDFLEWSQKQGQKYLFYKDSPHFLSDREAQRLSKWFTNYRQGIGLYEAKQDFHSFRHNFKTKFQQVFRGDNSIVDSVMGHAHGNEVSAAYFHGYRAKDIADAVKQLDFDLDFTRISQTRSKRRPQLELPSKPQKSARKPRKTAAAA